MSTDNFLSLLNIIEHAEMAELELNKGDFVMLFSWNPSDKYISPLDHDLKWETMVCKYLKHIKRCSRVYCIVPEFSPVGRLHCHGWLVIHDMIKWIKSVMPRFKRSGQTRFNQMRSSKALEYYLKDTRVTSGILKTSAPFSHMTHEDYLDEYKKQTLLKITKKTSQHKNINMSDYFDWPDILDT